MRRIAASIAVAAALVVPLTGSGAARAAAGTVNLTISNFRYCQRAVPVCVPTDQGYSRTANGPSGDGPAAPVPVHAGDTVVWAYQDNLCSAFQGGCPGHEVRLEGATAPVAPLVAWNNPGGTITYQVPLTATSGTLIRYYCSINNHWQFGMTGILQVS